MTLKITTTITTNDRGFQYGDGFFTTAAIDKGLIQFWDLHLLRLKECAHKLHFSNIDWQFLKAECESLSSQHSLAVLKVIITRGEGGRGYKAPDKPTYHAFLSISAFPTHYTLWQQQGIILKKSNFKLGHQPFLAGLKTLTRLEQVLVKEDAKQFSDCHDVIVLDLYEQVIETSMGNLLGYKNGQFFTPCLSNAGIKGVYLTSLKNKHAINETEQKLTFWQEMEVLFVCNSLMELVPVIQLNEKKFDIKAALNIKKCLV